jgi:hypothetical protein
MPLPFTNVPSIATEANKFGEAAEAVGGTSAAATASAIPNKEVRIPRVFIVFSFVDNCLFWGSL